MPDEHAADAQAINGRIVWLTQAALWWLRLLPALRSLARAAQSAGPAGEVERGEVLDAIVLTA